MHLYIPFFREIRKIFALLIDPEKQDDELLDQYLEVASKARVDVILVGGSLTSRPIDETILVIKATCGMSGVLFPGNLLQLSCQG